MELAKRTRTNYVELPQVRSVEMIEGSVHNSEESTSHPKRVTQGEILGRKAPSPLRLRVPVCIPPPPPLQPRFENFCRGVRVLVLCSHGWGFSKIIAGFWLISSVRHQTYPRCPPVRWYDSKKADSQESENRLGYRAQARGKRKKKFSYPPIQIHIIISNIRPNTVITLGVLIGTLTASIQITIADFCRDWNNLSLQLLLLLT
ncbi:hypothetical protein C7212DRAFT_362453 [Tuber magnatum]|uniref:Uncharacterized protein n=1 Tax=Tuber magnatum TaxID=42249 RepID=A0A317STV7_9PEZI|nr:hypothetical protein C7212DRAFT_362453 [Tuber magnatum]